MSNHLLFSIAPALAIYGTSIAGAAVKVPVQPSNLTVTPLGVNAFELKWKDNSDNESGWQIFASSVKGAPPVLYQVISRPDETSAVVIVKELPKREFAFQVAAYANNPEIGGKPKISKRTSIVSATTFGSTTFEAPTKLKVKVVDDGQVQLVWKDKSTSETGYQIEYKGGTVTKWTQLALTSAGLAFNVSSLQYAVLSPTTNYSFRVRAYNTFAGSSPKFTGYSNQVKIKTKAFQAPSKLVVTPGSEGAFSFKWNDKSSIENGFEVEKKSGTGVFTSLGVVPADVTSTDPVTGFDLDTDFQFRLRAYRTVGRTKTYTGYTNTVTIKSTTLTPPDTLAGDWASRTSVALIWKCASTRARGYEIEYREVGTTAYTTVTVGNVLTSTIPNLIPGAPYEFRLRAITSDSLGSITGSSSYTSSIQLNPTTETGTGAVTVTGTVVILQPNFPWTIPIQNIGEEHPHPPIFWGTSFLYPVENSRASALSSLTVSGLPAGLSFDSDTRTISGTPTEEGVKTVTFAATYSDAPGSTSFSRMVLRIVRPPGAPVAVAPFSSVNVTSGAGSTVSLTGKFEDPDTTSAVRLTTSAGVVDIILYPSATPRTVTNFLGYLNSHSYDNGFFHRSITEDSLHIVQGGGYRYTSSDGFSQVTKVGPVPGEPGISNLKGTVAMAKIASDARGGTSEFFVNLDDANAPNLDAQDGGFTVFGRVSAPTLAVIEGINALTTKNYTIPVGTGTQLLENVPTSSPTTDVPVDPALLIKIPTVTVPPILTYTVESADPTIADATVSGTDVTITGVASGSTRIAVTATDLDGQTVSQDIPVTVP